jgi:predicted acetyltransferase
MKLGEPTLVDPIEDMREEFIDYVQELRDAGESIWPEHSQAGSRDFHDFVRKLCDAAAGRNLKPGLVPWNEYWLVRRRRVLGTSSLRHRLTPALEDRGGHIGYCIRPGERGKGYGTQLLALTLEKAGELGLQRVLITCHRDNAASRRVIEKNGGVLSSEGICKANGEPVRRYWIEL